MKVDFEEFLRNEVTVEVTLTHVGRAKVRLWLAERIIRLGIWVAGTGLKWNEEVGVIVKDAPLEKLARPGRSNGQ
jgi:hypothetical protein